MIYISNFLPPVLLRVLFERQYSSEYSLKIQLTVRPPRIILVYINYWTLCVSPLAGERCTMVLRVEHGWNSVSRGCIPRRKVLAGSTTLELGSRQCSCGSPATMMRYTCSRTLISLESVPVRPVHGHGYDLALPLPISIFPKCESICDLDMLFAICIFFSKYFIGVLFFFFFYIAEKCRIIQNERIFVLETVLQTAGNDC